MTRTPQGGHGTRCLNGMEAHRPSGLSRRKCPGGRSRWICKGRRSITWLPDGWSGIRQRGEEFEPEELAYKPAVFGTDPSDDSEVLLEEEDLLFGIKKLMRAFEEMNGKSALDKRGELRNQFYLELARRPGERISEFCTRFRVMVGELKAEGVQLPSTELGWFLRTKLGLDPLREQLLETALAGKEEYDTIEREVLRLFKDLHAADPLHRRVGGEKGSMLQRFLGSQSGPKGPQHPTSSTASLSSSFPRSYRSSTTTSTTSSRLAISTAGHGDWDWRDRGAWWGGWNWGDRRSWSSTGFIGRCAADWGGGVGHRVGRSSSRRSWCQSPWWLGGFHGECCGSPFVDEGGKTEDQWSSKRSWLWEKL